VNRAEDQVAALEGKEGALLQIIATDDGAKLNGIELDSIPIFDGMAAANGNLYISTVEGEMICLGGK